MSLLLDAIRMVAAVELPCSVSVKSPKRKDKNPAIVLLWGIIEKSYCPYIHYKSIGLAYEKITMLLISRVFMSNVYDAFFFFGVHGPGLLAGRVNLRMITIALKMK